jgi:heme-degrading monooxygenase HmoA
MRPNRQAPSTVSTPFPRFAATGADTGKRALVVLTMGHIDQARRDEFDRETRRVIDAMAAQPGLLGFSARQELVGDTVWTLTVWENDRTLEQFLASAIHRRAVRRGRAAVVIMQSWRTELDVELIPQSWPETLAMFTGAGSQHGLAP